MLTQSDMLNADEGHGAPPAAAGSAILLYHRCASLPLLCSLVPLFFTYLLLAAAVFSPMLSLTLHVVTASLHFMQCSMHAAQRACPAPVRAVFEQYLSAVSRRQQLPDAGGGGGPKRTGLANDLTDLCPRATR